VFSFSRTTFSFHFSPWFSLDLVLSLHQGVFGPLVYVGIHQKICFKKVWMVLEKRKSFMQKSGTKRSLFRLRLRLFYVMLDIILILCLVIFVVAWLVSNDWDCLMSLWKNHALFLFCGSIYLVFSFDALFGLTWRMLTTCYDYKQVAISLYDHLGFEFWCHFMLLLMLLCRFAWL
jgi:hypothetical protein